MLAQSFIVVSGMTHRRHSWEDGDVEAEHGDSVREGPAASSASRSGRTRRHCWEDDADAFVERVREEGYAVGADDSDDDSEASASDWEIPESTLEDECVAELLELYLIRVLNARLCWFPLLSCIESGSVCCHEIRV